MCIVLEHESPIIQEPSGIEISVENYSPFLSLINIKNRLEHFEATGEDDPSYDVPEPDEYDEDMDWDADDFDDVDLDEDDDDFDEDDCDSDWNDDDEDNEDEDNEVTPDVDSDLHLADHEETSEPIF